MVKASPDSKFQVEVMHLGSPLPELMTASGECYVLAEKETSFIIRVTAKNPSIVYGACLTLDGQKVGFPRTFRGRCLFFGFRAGGPESYREFKFVMPELREEGEIGRKMESLRGCIQVDFYETFQKKRTPIFKSKKFQDGRGRFRQQQQQRGGENGGQQKEIIDQFEARTRDNCKKESIHAIAISQGKEFTVPRGEPKKRGEERPQKEVVDKVDLNKLIESVKIYYAEFFTLQMRGLINLNNIDHLKITPISLLRRNKFIVKKILKTIITVYDDPMDLTVKKLLANFQKYTLKAFDDLEVGRLTDLLAEDKDFYISHGVVKLRVADDEVFELPATTVFKPRTRPSGSRKMDIEMKQEEGAESGNHTSRGGSRGKHSNDIIVIE